MESTEMCESCWSRRGRWHLLDRNAEVRLCAACVRSLRELGETVERMDV